MLKQRTPTAAHQETIVVIGNGMVGLRFCEKLIAYDEDRRYRIVTFCEEPRAAYDRVGLTSFFAHRDAEKLLLARMEWYEQNGVELLLGQRADRIDRKAKLVYSDTAAAISYDHVVLATGSYPFVPPAPGIERSGVYLYRTIEDLERIIAHGARAKSAAVIGGGLLGLEAAKAVFDLDLETHIIDRSPRLMSRQVDEDGGRILAEKVANLGVQIHLNKQTREIHGNPHVERIEFEDGGFLDVDMIIVSAGIRPRDELARDCELEVGPRGGVVVNDQLKTSDPHIFAVGEVALHDGMIYGLVAPGYEMAEVVAKNLTGADACFHGTDVSTKLKLMGIDVASFGDYESGPEVATPLTFQDPLSGIYKKLLFSQDGKTLLGGILVGDASDYGMLAALARGNAALPCAPHELLAGPGPSIDPSQALGGDAQICSCNNVTKAQILEAIDQNDLSSSAELKRCTGAGTGCGGCMPMVADLYHGEMRRLGKSIANHLCEHFSYSRTELFAIIKTKSLKTFSQILAECGRGSGCEVCKPTIASILASLWNEPIIATDHRTLQDSNDRFLANIQRGGTFSVVPRVAGGEITPDKLIVLGQVAKDYGLYTKITGGQRIDMFGARRQDLPDIWRQLIDAGFESGHAYGKSVRTVKSCVGTTWCRFGVQDAVGTAIRIENRYKGIRAPHKIKMAVSGCIRECAEARGKDIGLIATDSGYNLYVCGNGGSKPRHAELLATNLDETTAISYIDRFLGYYITTADKLMRTSVWCESLEGGIDHIREVVVEDKLGLCAEFESLIANLVETYECEWTAVVNDPQRRRWFEQFANRDDTEDGIELVNERGQSRPADWPNELVSLEQFHSLEQRSQELSANESEDDYQWFHAGKIADFPAESGGVIRYGQSQIAVFNMASRGRWFATQNMCPHKKAFVLAQGILGDSEGIPKVACPMHKKTFSLESGESLQGEDYRIQTFSVRIDGDDVSIYLPPHERLDEVLATRIGCQLASSCDTTLPTDESAELVAAEP